VEFAGKSGLSNASLRVVVCSLACAIFVSSAPRTARAEEELRIALTSGVASVKVGGKGLSLFDGERGRRLASFAGDASLVIASAGGKLEAKGGGAVNLAGARRVFVEAEEAVRVDSGVYFGRVEIGPDPRRSGRLLVVNRLPLETYLLGIVGSEMSPAWPLEALKAQAVAARTYAMQRRAMMRAAARPYDLASTVISQVYKGAERIRPSVVEAVKQTRGEVMSYRHDLVEALFHSTCGGRTVSAADAFGGEVDYLEPVSCEWCRASGRYRWKISFSLAEISKRLRGAGLAKGAVRDVSRGGGDAKVRLRDGGGRRSIEPRALRKALGFGKLFSERFTVSTQGGRAHFEGRGFGHGVGLCQWGAHGQASSGRSYRQILAHYYPRTRLKRLY